MSTHSTREATPTTPSASAAVIGEDISPDEFRQRIVTVRNALHKAGLVGLVAFGDCWRGANIT